jgi:hypothetical protein
MLFHYFFGVGVWVGVGWVGGEIKTKTKLSPARASLLGLSLAMRITKYTFPAKLSPCIGRHAGVYILRSTCSVNFSSAMSFLLL